jgi:hypothetical protein
LQYNQYSDQQGIVITVTDFGEGCDIAEAADRGGIVRLALQQLKWM